MATEISILDAIDIMADITRKKEERSAIFNAVSDVFLDEFWDTIHMLAHTPDRAKMDTSIYLFAMGTLTILSEDNSSKEKREELVSSIKEGITMLINAKEAFKNVL